MINDSYRKLKPNELPVTILDTKCFSWKKNKAKGTWEGTAELSDFGRLASNSDLLFSRLYSDAIDLGLEITNHITRKTVRFYLKHIKEDSREGELLGYELESLDKTITVTLIND